MPTLKKRANFIGSEEGLAIEHSLQQMDADVLYNTESSFSANNEQYPDNLIPFVDKHMNYLRTHPAVNPQHYLSNLRLMTRLRK